MDKYRYRQNRQMNNQNLYQNSKKQINIQSTDIKSITITITILKDKTTLHLKKTLVSESVTQ